VVNDRLRFRRKRWDSRRSLCDGSVVRGSLGVGLLPIPAIAERLGTWPGTGWVVDSEFRTALPDHSSETRGATPRHISGRRRRRRPLAQAASTVRNPATHARAEAPAGGGGFSLSPRAWRAGLTAEAQAAEVLS
jgi:hypothetical protein